MKRPLACNASPLHFLNELLISLPDCGDVRRAVSRGYPARGTFGAVGEILFMSFSLINNGKPTSTVFRRR